MKKKINAAHCIYLVFCLVILIIAYLHESEFIPSNYLKANAKTEYFIHLFCIIMTLGESWFALRLFSLKQIQEQITKAQSNLLKWNIIRILMIGIPILINLEMYYALSHNQSILYCFLITLFAFVFCWPKDGQQIP